MREPTINDIDILARRLACLPDEDMLPAAESILARASYADKYRKRHGRHHAAWGGGDIASAVTADGDFPPNRSASDPDFLRAMALTCALLAARIRAHTMQVAA